MNTKKAGRSSTFGASRKRRALELVQAAEKRIKKGKEQLKRQADIRESLAAAPTSNVSPKKEVVVAKKVKGFAKEKAKSLVADRLPLPPVHSSLLQIFISMETTFALLEREYRKGWPYQKVKLAVERSCRRNIPDDFIPTINTLCPGMYDVQWHRPREKGEPELLIGRPLDKRKPTINRTPEVRQALMEHVLQYYGQFLSERNLGDVSVRQPPKVWHPLFLLEKVPRPEPCSDHKIPDPPGTVNLKKLMEAKDNRRISERLGEILAADEAKKNIKAEEEKNSVKESPVPSQVILPESPQPKKKSWKDRINPELLKKIQQREKERKHYLQASALDSEEMKTAEERQLRQVIKILDSVYSTEGKKVLPYWDVFRRLTNAPALMFRTESEIKSNLESLVGKKICMIEKVTTTPFKFLRFERDVALSVFPAPKITKGPFRQLKFV